ncbi:unnamed protein product [Rhizophagus irregularis]|nr:unnamed protein product [Rhizophagus irregularis]
MTRKRSLSSILNEESASRPHAIPSSRIQRTRSVSNIIDEKSSNQSYPTSSHIGRLVACRAPIGSVRYGFCQNRNRTELISIGIVNYRNRSISVIINTETDR